MRELTLTFIFGAQTQARQLETFWRGSVWSWKSKKWLRNICALETPGLRGGCHHHCWHPHHLHWAPFMRPACATHQTLKTSEWLLDRPYCSQCDSSYPLQGSNSNNAASTWCPNNFRPLHDCLLSHAFPFLSSNTHVWWARFTDGEDRLDTLKNTEQAK